MTTYAWEGRTTTGEVRKGQMEAVSEKDVITKLKQQRIIAAKVKKKFELKVHIPLITGGVPPKTLVVFTRQFATMLDAGLPLVQALDILASQEPNKRFKNVLLDVKTSVEGGSTFADALGKHPKIFNELFVNLVAAGEMAGLLDTILNRLAIYIEKNMKLVGKVKSTMTYPIGMLVVSVAVIIIMLVKVIPTFQSMFTSFGGGSLPGPTQLMIDLSAFAIKWFWAIILVIIGIVVMVITLLKNPITRHAIDRVILKMPIFGPVMVKVAVAKFTRTLGTMLASGVPILDGLTVVAKTSGNKLIEEKILYVRDKITEGKSIIEPLAEAKIFPSMVIQMIGVGESTGALDVMLNKIADFYEEEVDVAVSALTSLLEPIMMVFLGGIVGFLMISMYLPIFTAAGNVKAK